MIELAEVGAFAGAPTEAGVPVRFGIYLPGIHPADGYVVRVRVIHKDDRFTPSIMPFDRDMAPVVGSEHNLWQAEFTIPLIPGTNFGQSGKYLYRYQLLQLTPGQTQPRIVTIWFTDPFTRVTDDVGQLSAFVTPDVEAEFAWEDGGWKVPEVEDRIVYEIHVGEFNATFNGLLERLTYLKSLGVNCLELMPVTSLKLDFDWGYGPLHYFAPCERWGGLQGLKRLVNACHKASVAVILDVVYEHVDPTFPYALLYRDAGIASPMISGEGLFGPQVDFAKEFARNYVQTVNFHWLRDFHIDGLRYDQVTDLYDGPAGIKYAKMAFDDYNESLKIPRFTPSGGTKPGEYSRIIQAPEALNRPQQILRETYSNHTWQNDLLSKAEDMAQWNYVDDAFARLLDANTMNYPQIKTVHDINGADVEMPVNPYQYIESHDHSQLIAYVAREPGDVPFGDRSRFYKLQPFAIALYTCEGTPMLWQGQEFADNWVLPESGNGRIRLRRDMHWEYFYDQLGNPLVRLYRILGRLRHQSPALRSRRSFYYHDESRPRNGVIAYRRDSANDQQTALVFLNFSGGDQTIAVPFPTAGAYREMIDGQREITVAFAGEMKDVTVPPNYGCIFIK